MNKKKQKQLSSEKEQMEVRKDLIRDPKAKDGGLSVELGLLELFTTIKTCRPSMLLIESLYCPAHLYYFSMNNNFHSTSHFKSYDQPFQSYYLFLN